MCSYSNEAKGRSRATLSQGLTEIATQIAIPHWPQLIYYQGMATSSNAVPQRFTGLALLLLGLALPVLGVIGYVVQFNLGNLKMPWYLPGLAALGVVLVIFALVQKRTLWRSLALVLLVLLTGAECAFLFGLRAPAYTGPLAVGERFPAFTTMRADGTTFTQRDLEGSQNNVLVVFRGRW
jgi:hypothetical protein